MQHTLVAVFDDRSDALKSRDALLAAGFGRDDLRLSEGDPTGHVSDADPVIDRREDESFGDSFRHFFSNIFGADRGEAARMYSEAVARGHYVLMLTASAEPEVERGAAIVERFGPIDIEEKHQHWRAASLLQGRTDGRQQLAPASQQLAPGVSLGRGASDAGGQVQGGAALTPQRPSTGGEPRHGNARIYHALEATLANNLETVDDSTNLHRRSIDMMVDPADVPAFHEEFRKHWDDNFAEEGPFDEYAPAYRYGVEKKTSELFRNRPWDEAVEDLRIDWEAIRPGSAWEKFKAAVRHGWDRITH